MTSPLTAVLTARADRANLPPPVIEDLTNRAFGTRFSTSLMTGFMQLSVSLLLPRWRAYEWYERYSLYGINIYEAFEPVWEGRIVTVTLRDYGVDVECEGYWSSMADQVMMSWWNDNDMSQWKTPMAGAGAISDEINLSGAGAGGKFNLSSSANFLSIGTRRGVIYAAGDIGCFYYKLPNVRTLTDKRLFQPMTIHSIQFVFDMTNPGGSPTLKVWTGTQPIGTWVEAMSYPSTEGNKILTANLVADGVSQEAIAIGHHIGTGYTENADDRLTSLTNVIIFAERDATSARRTTARKIIKDLLLGQSPDTSGVTAHAKQVSDDTSYVEKSDIEIIPAKFENMTLQDIITKTCSFGLSDAANLIDNPSAEVAVTAPNGWVANGVTGLTQAVAGQAPLTNSGSWGASCSVPAVSSVGIIWSRAYILNPVLVIPGRYIVEPGKTYTVSLWAKTSLGRFYRLVLRFADIAERPGGSVTEVVSDALNTSATYTRFSVSGVCPADRNYVEVEFRTDGVQGAHTLTVDAIQLEEGAAATFYKDGETTGFGWAGEPHRSMTTKVVPAIVGVFGRNRLHIRRRGQTDAKWILSVKELGEEGLSLQKSVQDFWVRVWAKYEEAFSGITKIAPHAENKLEQALIYDQRDTILTLGQGLSGFAHAAAKQFLKDSRRPRQASTLSISGYINNNVGGKEPGWRVKAGDLVYVQDLSPLPTAALIADEFDPTSLDKLRTFVVKETDYDVPTATLTIVPDAPPSWLELLLAGVESVPSFSVGGPRAGGSGGGGTNSLGNLGGGFGGGIG